MPFEDPGKVGNVRRAPAEPQRMELVAIKHRSGCTCPSVVSNQKVRDYYLKIPHRFRKHDVGQPFRREIHFHYSSAIAHRMVPIRYQVSKSGRQMEGVPCLP